MMSFSRSILTRFFITTTTTNNNKILSAAATANNESAISFLHQSSNKSKNNEIDHFKQRELYEACFRGNIASVRTLLLNKIVGVNAKYDPIRHGSIGGLDCWAEGATCLMFASAKGRVDVVKTLLDDFQANVHQTDDENGCNALMSAAFYGQPLVVQLLIEQFGANIHHKDRRGRNALMKAALQGKCNVVDYLLKKGANPHDKDDDGKTVVDLVVAKDIFRISNRILMILQENHHHQHQQMQ